MVLLRTLGLFVITALSEIIGCFLPYLWLRKNGSPWPLVPAALSLAIFAWLLTSHPAAAGREYAAYGRLCRRCSSLALESGSGAFDRLGYNRGRTGYLRNEHYCVRRFRGVARRGTLQSFVDHLGKILRGFCHCADRLHFAGRLARIAAIGGDTGCTRRGSVCIVCIESQTPC